MLRGQETDKMKLHHFGKVIGNRHICKPQNVNGKPN